MNENQQESLDEVQIGRVLHFVTEHYGKPQCRPALVVEDWPNQGKPGYVNIVVFPDGTNDGKYGTDEHDHPIPPSIAYDNQLGNRIGKANVSLMTRWETSVMPNHAVRAVRSWHWPRECVRLRLPMEPLNLPDEGLIHHNHEANVVDIANCYACSRQAKTTAEA